MVNVLWLMIGVRIDLRRSGEVEDEKRGVDRTRRSIECKERRKHGN